MSTTMRTTNRPASRARLVLAFVSVAVLGVSKLLASGGTRGPINAQSEIPSEFNFYNLTYSLPTSDIHQRFYDTKLKPFPSGKTAQSSRRNLEENTPWDRFPSFKLNDNNPANNQSNEDKDNTTTDSADDSNTVIITIEGTIQPLFFCKTCQEALQLQQDAILSSLNSTFVSVQVVASTQRLLNALFVRLSTTTIVPKGGDDEDGNWTDNSQSQIFQHIRQIEGVQRVYHHERYHTESLDVADFLGGGYIATDDFCVSGRGVRIAVLDSGMDYTHIRLGGPGTTAAYEAAYGVGVDSTENKVLDETKPLFPNNVVVGGYDFLGEDFVHESDATAEDAHPDENPIDGSPGHGTAVGDAILQVAFNAQLVALKVCVTGGDHTCPDFAIAQGIEYALDPNGDNDIEDRVDIINLSLGLSDFSPYYDLISKMIEDA